MALIRNARTLTRLWGLSFPATTVEGRAASVNYTLVKGPEGEIPNEQQLRPFR